MESTLAGKGRIVAGKEIVPAGNAAGFAGREEIFAGRGGGIAGQEKEIAGAEREFAHLKTKLTRLPMRIAGRQTKLIRGRGAGDGVWGPDGEMRGVVALVRSQTAPPAAAGSGRGRDQGLADFDILAPEKVRTSNLGR